MKPTGPSKIHPLQRHCGYLGRDFRVVLGVNQRDALSCRQELVEGDIYRMDMGAERHILRGAVQFDALLVLMTQAGVQVTLAIGTDPWDETVMLASAEIAEGTEYELIKIETSVRQITGFVIAAHQKAQLEAVSRPSKAGLRAVQP